MLRDRDGGLSRLTELLVAASAGWTTHGVSIMLQDLLKFLITQILVKGTDSLEQFVELRHPTPP